ncbi:MAG TPA: methyltransferase domain-containing protein [Acidimicrobiales bacterium]|nr:methyltransferase domain-containing protein [Acidimicrobiales bacterium]
MGEDVYTHGHHDSVLRSHRWRTAENSAAYLLPHLAPGRRLLDVGCGPGTLTVDLASRVAPGAVVAVDIADDVLPEARRHAAEQGADNVELVAGDFRELGLAEGSFDVAHAHQVLQHLVDPVGALAAMARLVRPGGVVAARDGDSSAFLWAPANPGLDRWQQAYVEVTRRNRAEAAAGRYLPAWARAAGLDDVTYTTSTWTFATPDERAWWSDVWAERSVASSFAEQALGYGIATQDELEDLAAGWRLWGATPDAVLTIVHGEIICRV